MKDLANIILILYLLCNAGIVYYFFVYKNRQADREYEYKIKRLRGEL